MPTGKARGFTYLWLLFAIALSGAGLGAVGHVWQTALQRERELESMFRGQQIADAVGAWRAVSAALDASIQPGPLALEELLEDRRGPRLQRHLRQVYSDPLTGRADWVLVLDSQGAVQALHSRSRLAPLITRDLEPAPPGQEPCVCDRVYRARLMSKRPSD